MPARIIWSSLTPGLFKARPSLLMKAVQWQDCLRGEVTRQAVNANDALICGVAVQANGGLRPRPRQGDQGARCRGHQGINV
jgi:hypothetical protein